MEVDLHGLPSVRRFISPAVPRDLVNGPHTPCFASVRREEGETASGDHLDGTDRDVVDGRVSGAIDSPDVEVVGAGDDGFANGDGRDLQVDRRPRIGRCPRRQGVGIAQDSGDVVGAGRPADPDRVLCARIANHVGLAGHVGRILRRLIVGDVVADVLGGWPELGDHGGIERVERVDEPGRCQRPGRQDGLEDLVGSQAQLVRDSVAVVIVQPFDLDRVRADGIVLSPHFDLPKRIRDRAGRSDSVNHVVGNRRIATGAGREVTTSIVVALPFRACGWNGGVRAVQQDERGIQRAFGAHVEPAIDSNRDRVGVAKDHRVLDDLAR